MGQNADQLKREIADTRNDLGNTLDAIGDRVSPSRVIQRRKNRVTGIIPRWKPPRELGHRPRPCWHRGP